MDAFWYKVLVVVILMVAQGALWIWVGMQAQKFNWWPLRFNQDFVATEQSGQAGAGVTLAEAMSSPTYKLPPQSPADLSPTSGDKYPRSS